MKPWLMAFVFTQLVEIPVYVFAMARAHGSSSRVPSAQWSRGLVAFGASALTHPIVWFEAPRAWVHLYLFVLARVPAAQIRSPLARYVVFIVLAETFAVVIEAIYLRVWGLRRAWAWALLANGASVSLGLASRAVFGVP